MDPTPLFQEPTEAEKEKEPEMKAPTLKTKRVTKPRVPKVEHTCSYCYVTGPKMSLYPNASRELNRDVYLCDNTSECTERAKS